MKGRNRARRLVSVSRQLGQVDPVRTNQKNIALVHLIIKLRARFFWEEKQSFRVDLLLLFEPRCIVRLQQCEE